jgi:ribosomal protein S18 acetylase RimI-like enzyme
LLTVKLRSGTEADIVALLPLMREFYAFEKIEFDAGRSERLLRELLADERKGRITILEDAGEIAGYLVMGFGFSLEFHGRNALIDELFVRPEMRERGLGRRAIEHALEMCREEGIRCVQLEADHFNVSAHEFYKRLGFRDHARHLMTRWL